MTLRQRQSLFTFLVARLIIFANENQYELTFSEAYRSPSEAARLAREGKGIKNSLHIKRLAIDLNLFKDGKYLSSTESHRVLGEWWERQHPLCRWGGRWNDGNHYEVRDGAE